MNLRAELPDLRQTKPCRQVIKKEMTSFNMHSPLTSTQEKLVRAVENMIDSTIVNEEDNVTDLDLENAEIIFGDDEEIPQPFKVSTNMFRKKKTAREEEEEADEDGLQELDPTNVNNSSHESSGQNLSCESNEFSVIDVPIVISGNCDGGADTITTISSAEDESASNVSQVQTGKITKNFFF